MQVWLNFFGGMFGPFEICQFKTNCSGLQIDWGSPSRVQLFTECVLLYIKTFCCFAHIFVDSACKQLTTVSSQARNLFRPNRLLDILTNNGCVNNFISFFK